MKYINHLILTLFLGISMASLSQPATVKNVTKSVFKLTTYRSDGSVLANSHGVFIGTNGEAITSLQPFIGAGRATVTDANGKSMEVTHIEGINDMYDVAKIKVNGKTTPTKIASSPVSSGSQVWLIPYSTKKPTATAITVKNIEVFMNQYSYYIFSSTAPDNTDACPFVNTSGEIIGLMHKSTTSNDLHATDSRFVASLKNNGLSINDATMKKIGIPASLPDNKEQALLSLMMIGQSMDSIKIESTINDFITAYPTMTDGYTARAQRLINENKFEDAAKTMDLAIQKSEKKDEAHYNYSKLIYDKNISKANIPYEPWNLDAALEQARKAYSIKAHPTYKQQEAKILFLKGEYTEAYKMFINLTTSEIRNAELFYEAAQCKKMMKAPEKETIALLDSAINNTDTLRLREAAPYFLMRGEIYNEIDSFRQAVFDYTRYEVLSNGQVNDRFFHMREQAEVKARLYKQALIDITTAILINPKEPTYYAEKASLELKVNMTEQALKTAEACIKVAPEYATGYLLLGLAQIKSGNKTSGLNNLEKAKQLGEEQAQTLIDKYSK